MPLGQGLHPEGVVHGVAGGGEREGVVDHVAVRGVPRQAGQRGA